MNKVEMLRAVVEIVNENADKKSRFSQNDVSAILDAFVDVVLEEMKNGEKKTVTLPRVGTFSVKHVPEKSGVSYLGEKKPWHIPAHNEVVFKLLKAFKHSL